MTGPSIGGTFAGHRVEAEAGRGGMGVVYRAVDLDLDRVVALKVIAPEYAKDPDFRERFKRECRLAASLSHPNIVPIYRAGEEEGLVFVTMAFIDGTDMRALLREGGRLDPHRAVALLEAVAAGLDAAHGAGLVHRDVKPGNVLVGDDGQVYLTDFGLTKHTGSETKMTGTGMFVGTLDYIAPEQLEGGAVDARSDVYSLACMLYELLTGQVPFPRNVDTAKMWAHVGEAPPTPTTSRPDLPEKFDEVIVRGMAKAPDDRFPSAGDLARAAEAALEGRDPDAPEHSVARGRAAPAGAAEALAKATTQRGAAPAPSRTRGRRGLVVVAGLVAAAAAVAGGLALTGGDGGGNAATCNAAGGLGTKERPLRIYSSLILQGPAAKQSQATLSGARLALAEAGGKAGGCVVALTSRDTTTATSDGTPDQKLVERNARRAVADRAGIAYIGEWNSGATAWSLPITNRGGLAQLSPSNTDPALTIKAPGVGDGQPDKHYPTRRRTYVRVMPSAVAMTADMVVVARQYGCRTASVVRDEDPYGDTMTALAKTFGARLGVRVRDPVEIKMEKPDVEKAAAAIKAQKPPCIIFAAIGTPETPRLLNALNRATPRAWIIGGDAIFFDELGSEMSAPARVRTRATAVPVPAGAFSPAGRAFFRRLRAEYGSEVIDPFAAHGYEAMSLTLDAIERAGESGRVDRASVVKALFATRNRKSILGTYSVDRNGDTSLSAHGLFQPGATRFRFERVVRVPPGFDLSKLD